MIDQKILDGNKLIAESKYVGATSHYTNSGTNVLYKIPEGKRSFIGALTWARWEDLQYHKSWDWLMPIIELIAKEPLIGQEDYVDVCYPRTFGMPAEDGTVMFRFNGFPVHHAATLIEAAWLAVLDFISFDLESLTTQTKDNG